MDRQWQPSGCPPCARLAFVPTVNARDEDSPAEDRHGYQREPNARRFPGIGKHYLAGGAITPLLVSVRHVSEDERDAFTRLLKAGEVDLLHEEYTPRVFAIVDGQHRLGGMAWAQDENPDFDPSVPCILFFGLGYAEEARLFDTVNTKQKAIPRPLVEFTKATITEIGGDTYEQKIRAIALAEDDDSAWKGRVNLTGATAKGGRKTTFEGLRRSMMEMYPREILARVEGAGHDPLAMAKVWWFEVAEACAPAWQGAPEVAEDGTLAPVAYRLTDLVGIATVARLGKDAVVSAMERFDREETPVFDTLREYAQRLEAVDWRKGGQSDRMTGLAGWAGVTSLYEALYPVVFPPVATPRRGRQQRAA